MDPILSTRRNDIHAPHPGSGRILCAGTNLKIAARATGRLYFGRWRRLD
jgi:hypothetical protein